MNRTLPILIFLVPQLALACACGCGLFDVGTSAMYPGSSGGMAFIEYDYLDQNQNRSSNHRAPAEDNEDKTVTSRFAKVGVQYLFNRVHGAQIEVPYWSRTFRHENAGNLITTDHKSLGDIRLIGIYTGFSEDMSTGLTYGLKLNTGDSSFTDFDSDTEIGSGSTDLLLGLYHLFKVTDDGQFNGFVQANLDQPFITKSGYVPGNEMNFGIGAYYAGWEFGGAKVAPILASVFSVRGSDNGPLANTGNSGYGRVLLAPGLETTVGHFRVNTTVQVPIYQFLNGNQLAAPVAYKLAAMYLF
jgi:hypothetical protein